MGVITIVESLVGGPVMWYVLLHCSLRITLRCICCQQKPSRKGCRDWKAKLIFPFPKKRMKKVLNDEGTIEEKAIRILLERWIRAVLSFLLHNVMTLKTSTLDSA